MRGTTRWAVAAGLGAMALLGACGSDDDNAGPELLPPDATVGDSTITDLFVEYAKALVEVPLDANMLADPAQCDMGRSTDDVYFAPTFGAPGETSTSCSMSSDQSLLLVPAAVFCMESPDEAADVACLDNGWDLTSASVSIDGVETTDLAAYEIDTPVETASLPDGNIFELPAGDTPQISRGQVVLVDGLEAGDHEVVVAADFGDGEFAGSLTIALTVE